MNACRAWNDRLLDFALGSLRAADARNLAAHLERCPACAAAAADLRHRRQQLDAALAELAPAAEPSPSFAARVLAAAERTATPARLELGAAQPAWLGALAAVTLLLFATLLAPSTREPASRPQAASLSHWRSPTASLLDFPGRDFLRFAPRLGELYFPLERIPSADFQENGGSDES